jgi:hypothetical protein
MVRLTYALKYSAKSKPWTARVLVFNGVSPSRDCCGWARDGDAPLQQYYAAVVPLSAFLHPSLADLLLD